ncbi:MAG: SLC13 family permease [Rhodospirillales bacterium]
MTEAQAVILGILAVTVLMFLWGRWRHDMVAVAALLACVLAGLVPTAEAFAGFGHPAVITVACVLVLSRGLQASGAVDALARTVLPTSLGPTATIAAVSTLGAFLSAFMNNVGALALLMPVAIQIAERQQLPAGRVLMPLAFGSILGGMTTLIGTPPNLIVSGFRAGLGGGGFAMFDFTPVGAAVALIALAFVAAIGWRLVPARRRGGVDDFETGAYLTEARVPEKAKAVGMTLREIEKALVEADAQVVGLVRNEVRVSVPNPARRILAGDILVIEAEPKALAVALEALDLKLEEAKKSEKIDETADAAATKEHKQGEEPRKSADAEESALVELAVLPDSTLSGRSAMDIRLRTSFGVNLLAISRQGRRSMARLRTLPLRAGDVLLMQGTPEAIAGFAAHFGCVPLAERTLRLPDKRQVVVASSIMVAAIAGAAFGLLPAAISFAAAVLASMALRVIPPRRVYEAIDWPVIVLLGALIPVAGAMATTGAADLIARLLLDGVAGGSAIVALAVILVVTMTLSDFMNNAATAAVMGPIAIGTATSVGAAVDPFLMAVAVGASCAFLTPIGHQNNTLILGPGGFGFGDYWRLGLPVELIVVAVGVPMILLVWPL